MYPILIDVMLMDAFFSLFFFLFTARTTIELGREREREGMSEVDEITKWRVEF